MKPNKIDKKDTETVEDGSPDISKFNPISSSLDLPKEVEPAEEPKESDEKVDPGRIDENKDDEKFIDVDLGNKSIVTSDETADQKDSDEELNFIDDPESIDFSNSDESDHSDDGVEGINPDEVKKANATIREHLKKVSSELKSIKESSKQEVEDLKRERDEALKSLQEFSSNEGVDAFKHPRVREVLDPFNKKISVLGDEMSLLSDDDSSSTLNREIASIIKMVAGLGAPGSDGFSERKSQLMSSIEDRFDKEFHGRIISLAKEGVEVSNTVSEIAGSIKTDSKSISVERGISRIKSLREDYREVSKHQFKASQDLIESDPYNFRSLVQRYIDDESTSKTMRSAIDEALRFAESASIPPLPVNPSDVPDLSTEEISAKEAKSLSDWDSMSKKLLSTAAEGRVARRMVPGMQKKIDQLEERIKKLKGARPTPKIDTDTGDSESNSDGDIKKFNPSPVSL